MNVETKCNTKPSLQCLRLLSSNDIPFANFHPATNVKALFLMQGYHQGSLDTRGDGGIDVKSEGLSCIKRLEIKGFRRTALVWANAQTSLDYCVHIFVSEENPNERNRKRRKMDRTKEAAEYLGVQPATIRDWIRKGKDIPHKKIGKT